MFAAEMTRNSTENLLLRLLPPEERRRLIHFLQPVAFSIGQVVFEPGERLIYGYLPTSTVVSLLYTMEDGSTAEMGIIGNDGVIGTSIFLGGHSTCSRAVVAVAGESFKIPATVLLEEFSHGGAWQSALLRYTQALLIQVSQTAVCNSLHSVERRLCRWLLLCHDRTNSSEMLMTQGMIANMLGGRRESVTLAAGRLQNRGLIHYSHGHITILDRNGLEASACECYRVVEDERDRLFGRMLLRQLSRPGRAA
jgi:CRP-like cAMP-binding protein